MTVSKTGYVRATPKDILSRLKEGKYPSKGRALIGVSKMADASEEEKSDLRSAIEKYFSAPAVKKRKVRAAVVKRARKSKQISKPGNMPAFLRCALALLNNEEVKAQVFDLLEHARAQKMSAGQLLDALAVA